MSEGSGESGHQGLKKECFWRVFWAWSKVWVDGAESNEENALADNF